MGKIQLYLSNAHIQILAKRGRDMRRTLFSTLGTVLVIAAIAGMAISIFGIFGVWRVEKDVKTSLINAVDLLDTTLKATHDGLTIAATSLDKANDSLVSLVSVVRTTGQTVEDTIPLINSLEKMTTEDLPNALGSTQTALQSAQASARVIDTTLSVLTTIPFLSTPSYNNQLPLGTAFGGVAESLDPMIESLSSMDESLQDSRKNIKEVNLAFGDIADNLASMETSLKDARGVTTQYLDVLEDLELQLDKTRQNLPRTLDGISAFITIALIWLAISQLGLLMQGLEMLGLDFVKENVEIVEESIKLSEEEK